LGLLLSAIPFPPSVFLGFILNIINLALIVNGSLSRKELGLVAFSLIVAVTNVCVFVFLLGLFRAEVLGVWHELSPGVLRLMSIFPGGTAVAPQSPNYSLKHI
jgi:hypothetical protein